MKLKLNRSEFEALHALLKNVLPGHNQIVKASMEQLMCTSILEGVFSKLHAKEYTRQAVYSFTFKTHEAIAFYLYFRTVPVNHTTYEGNLVITLSHQIHKQYSQHLLS